MNNKEKKVHHFVPQVYLRKFAHTTEKTKNYFVSTYDKINSNENLKNNVKNICYKTKLYTIDSSDKEERESIENFYAETIEKNYNRFYDIITDDQKITINQEERELIIITIMNLYLRNLYWFKTLDDFWTGLIKSFENSTPVNVYAENGKILFPFEDQNIDKIISDHKIRTKQAIIEEQLKGTINLTKSHFQDIIFVDKRTNNAKFITSDRPVICESVSGSFRLPINKDYILTIIPNKENITYNLEKIVRNNPFMDARIFNVFQYENSARLIIGFDMNEIKQAKNDFEKAIKN